MTELEKEVEWLEKECMKMEEEEKLNDDEINKSAIII